MRVKSSRALKGALVLAVLAAGCTALPWSPSPPPPARVNQSGFSVGFRQGYADGCGSADARGQRRDENRYKTETDYQMGWNDGYSACQRR